jgi:hypothetical protein
VSGPSIYHGRDQRRSNRDQQRERDEPCGLYEPNEPRVWWEQDHQDDVAAERRGVEPKLRLRPARMNTNLRMAA